MKGKQIPQEGGKKHIFGCCHRTCSKCAWFVLGGVPFVLGIVAIVLAIVIVAGADAALKSSVEEATVISSTEDESYENFVTTKMGVSFGGSEPDEDDEGTEHITYISNVTNLHEVYTQGARPHIQDVPYSFRRYTYNHEASVDGDRLKFQAQTVDFPTAETQAKWENDIIFVPNIGWAGLKAQLDGLTVGARVSGDALTIAAPFTQVEDLLRPVFTQGALASVLPALDGFLRTTMFPINIAVFEPVLVGNPFSGDDGLLEVINRPPDSANPTATLTTSNLQYMRVNEPLVASFIPGFNATLHRPTLAEAKLLFSVTYIASTFFGGAVPTSASAAAYSSLTTNPAFAGVVDAVTANYAALGSSAPAADVITIHAAYLVYHAFTKVSPLATAADKAGFEAASVVALNALANDCAFYSYGGSAAGGRLSTWAEVVGAHMGSGALLPAVKAGACDAGTTGPFLQVAIGGYFPNNASSVKCVAGTSLFDIVNNPALMPSTPEMACTVNRAPSALDGLVGASHYGSRLPAATMAALLSNFTTGATVAGAIGQALLGPVPGSNSLRVIAVVRAQMLAAWPSIVTKAAPLAALVAQQQAASSAIPNLENWIAGNRTAVEATMGPENKACGDRLQSYNLPRMTCLQLLDTFSWIDHVARNFAFYPTAVWNSPINTAAATPGVDPRNIMSGPFVKSTARELLQNGTLDSLLQGLLPAAARGLALTVPDRPAAAYLAGRPTATQGTVLNNGAEDISKLWTVLEYNGSATDTTYQATALSPTDSITMGGQWGGQRREPTFDVDTEVSEAPLTEKGFLTTIARFVYTVFTGEVKGPNGLLDLWRYELLPVPEMQRRGVANPRLLQESTSDSAWGQPACMIGTRPTDITKPGADIFLSSPHYSLCDAANELQFPDGARVNEPHSTFTTSTDVDPVSGFTLQGTQRVGIYVRMEGSDWFPTIPRRNATGQYYHQISWQFLQATAPRETESDLNDGYNQVRAIQADLPPSLFSVGAILIIVGLLFLAVALTYPKKSDVGDSQWQDEHIDDSSPQYEGSNPMASKDP